MSSTDNKHDKLEQIMYITRRIEEKDNKDDYILDKISAKLKILETISQCQWFYILYCKKIYNIYITYIKNY